MKERPILFSAPMVRAILDGSKTQTRRVVKMNASGRAKLAGSPKNWHLGDPEAVNACPYGLPGDRLWVRETWGRKEFSEKVYYRANDELGALVNLEGDRWRPSIHMPRKLSRLTLEVVSVRVERLTSISEEDAWAEGIEPPMICDTAHTAITEFRSLWDTINGAGSWDANPWVWVVEFRKVEEVSRG